jgi:G:T/U-mismatch repair DNA glycosylase
MVTGTSEPGNNFSNHKKVVHRFVEKGWYTPEGAKAILLGTFPSVLIREAFGRIRTTDVDFFYGSRDNNFWNDLSIIYKRPLSFERTDEAIRQRMQLLNDLQLGMSDAIFACTTTGSSMDTALQHIELNKSLIDTLDNHPSVTNLYFTSSSGKVNAETLTLRMLKENGNISKMKIIQASRPRIREFIFTGVKGQPRIIRSVTLISPSPLAEQMAGILPEQRRAQYEQYLPPINNKL